MTTYRRTQKGFTLVEILIVVIILGILAAIVIPQFTNASTDARRNSVTSQLQTLRSQVQLYKLQHNDKAPDLAAGGNGMWTLFTSATDASGTIGTGTAFPFGPYMQGPPVNPLNGKTDVAAAAANGIGWVYDSTTGAITATNQTQTLVFDETTGSIE